MLQAEGHVQRPGDRKQQDAFEELKEVQCVKRAMALAQVREERPYPGGP